MDFVKETEEFFAILELKLAIGIVGVLVGLALLVLAARWKVLTRQDRDAAPVHRSQEEEFRDYLALVESLKRPGLCGRVAAKGANPTQTRLGGPTLCPVEGSPPLDKSGHPLMQVLLVDLATIPDLGALPREGYLQVLIEGDDLFGETDGDEPDMGRHRQVVLHPPGTQFRTVANVGDYSFHPFLIPLLETEGMGLEWSIVDCPPSRQDYRLQAFVEKRGWPITDWRDPLDNIWQDLSAQRGKPDVMLLGNPEFVASDRDMRSADCMTDWINLVGLSSAGGAFVLLGQQRKYVPDCTG